MAETETERREEAREARSVAKAALQAQMVRLGIGSSEPHKTGEDEPEFATGKSIFPDQHSTL